MSTEQLIEHYGYIAIFAGTFLEGETILVIAGFLAHRGYLELPIVIGAAFAGTFFGDQLYFFIGRIKGRSFIQNRPSWKSKSERVLRLLAKHQNLLILGFRFIYGIRTITPFLLGTSGISPLRYILLNFCGGILWAGIFSGLGYYFGQLMELILGRIKNDEKWGILVLLGISALTWLIYKWHERKTNKNNKP